MKLHKVNNKRNERLFKRLTESCGCAVTEETIDEGPFDAIKDKVGDLADKVTGKKRGSAVGGKGFNANGESQEDGYDQKIFGAWNARAGAAAGIYQSLVDPNGSFFKAVANRSISPQKAKPIDFAKAFSSMMQKNVHLRGMMKDWSKGRADKLYNLLSPNQVKGLNQILNSKNKHQGDGERTVGALFYNKLANMLNDMRIGEVEYQEYLSNSEGLRSALRTLAKSMLSPKKGRAGERPWKEFTRGANSELGFELPAAAAITAAEFVAEEFEERRQAGTLEEELETIVSEDSESDTAMVNLLSQISQKLDGLEDIDTSIDYLIGALSGETALSAKMKQSTLGRFADASPQMAELIKKYQE